MSFHCNKCGRTLVTNGDMFYCPAGCDAEAIEAAIRETYLEVRE